MEGKKSRIDELMEQAMNDNAEAIKKGGREAELSTAYLAAVVPVYAALKSHEGLVEEIEKARIRNAKPVWVAM